MAWDGMQLSAAPPATLPTCPRPTRPATDGHRLFSAAILLSATRCLLGYVVLPLAAPLAGATATLAPVIGIPVAGAALVFDVRAIRRFWLARHRWRWPMTALYVALMGMVVVLLAGDVSRLVS